MHLIRGQRRYWERAFIGAIGSIENDRLKSWHLGRRQRRALSDYATPPAILFPFVVRFASINDHRQTLAITILGSFPSYTRLSDQIGSRRFEIDPAVWVSLSRPRQWAANRHFLDAMVAAGDKFILSSDPSLARPGSWLFHELHHLRTLGAKVPSIPSTHTVMWVP